MAATKNEQTWRYHLFRDVGWSLLVKVGLLTLLWALFFSGSHRCRVDGPATASRLALEARQADSQGQTVTSGGDRCD
jgi:hypothetical protein